MGSTYKVFHYLTDNTPFHTADSRGTAPVNCNQKKSVKKLIRGACS